MQSNEIRSKFLKFFADRGHRVVRSSSLVPANDPTLLFANAGMNRFKDVFLGREKRDYSRACSSQKCVRAGGKHNDLEQVGRTTRHHTFFEMLGNFSFGDYFKADAIPWAWELVTKDFAIPKEKLYATVFREDDEAEELWAKIVARDRIFRMDEKDNFWAMGDTGPCGPCSEIHYDLGPAASEQGHADCRFPCDCGRYVELWNLVFMQFNRDESGTMTPLPRPSIDTGAGLERMATVLQGKISNFENDLFRPLIEEAAELTGAAYGANQHTDVSLRVIADHARAATFLVSDGVLPSNEGRGYVLRKIMRRAIVRGRALGLDQPFLFRMTARVAEMMKDAYPELIEAEPYIARAVKAEEKRFANTVFVGLLQLSQRLDALTSEMHLAKASDEDLQTAAGQVFGSELAQSAATELRGKLRPNPVLPGDVAFTVYETYGLPLDLIEEYAGLHGIPVDTVGFDQAMERERERARASWKGAEKKVVLPVYQKLGETLKTDFDGYLQTTSLNCKILVLVQNGESANEVKPGREVEIVLDHTPFYGESGGQVGDVGHLLAPGSTQEVAHVSDTYRPVTGIIAHKAVARETLHVGDVVTAVVDAERRDAIRRNHTATHLLHAALRSTLGPHVKQAGSLVAPDRLRFDFSHYAALGEQDVLDIEDLVNQHILRNEEMRTEVMDLDAAVNSGAMALFGEKYGDKVRVVAVADGSYSKELCGGTHVNRTGDIGLFKVVSEGSVAAGTRRIEALTGTGVLEQLRESSEALALLGGALRAKPDELLQAAEKLAESEKKLRKQIEAQQLKRAASEAGDLVDRAREVKGVRVIAERVELSDRGALRQMVDNLRPRITSGVIVLGNAADGKVSLIVGVTKDLTNRLDAGKIVKAAAAIVGGGGGGRKDLAEAGGTKPEKLDESLEAISGIIEKML